MKNIEKFLTAAAIFFTIATILPRQAGAQTPQAFNYQTVVRDAAGEIIQNQNVSLRFSIHDVNATGAVIYSETHTVMTNQFGLANLEIGTGMPVLGTFPAIDWGTNSKYLEVELDPSGGSSYTSMGTTQLMSVPYALYSENTANTDDDDADPANELQTLSIAGNDLSITNGNTVTLPGSGINNRISDDDGNTWIDTEVNSNNDSIIFYTMGMERMVISHNGYIDINGQLSATGFTGDGSGLTGVPGDDLGDHTATDDLDMNNYHITNVVSPIDANDAATKLYVDTQISLNGDNLGNHIATQNIALDSNWVSNDGDNEGIYVDTDGNVGINTLSPDQELTVNGSIRAGNNVMAGYGTTDSPAFRFGEGTENSGLSSPYFNSVAVITDGAERLTVRQNGNVGIGLTNPQAPLHIIGHIRMNDGNQGPGKVLTSDGLGNAMWDDPVAMGDGDWEIVGDDMYSEVSGNVGIGTAAPGAKLEVAGHISQTGTGNSTFIGEGAGENDDLSNNENVFVGKGAGSTNTNGGQNTATGFESLQNNIDGDYNTAYGNKALKSNTTADGNTAVGYASLNNNTTGQGNTAMGISALNKNTSGTNNTASGTQALYNNLTGQSNSATGYQAQYYNKGDRNTAFGSQAMKYQEDGNNNTAVGYEAGKGTTYHNKTGGVFIGYQAGKNEMDNNKLYIENSSSSTPLIGGDFAADEVYLNGDVGIGTDSPTAELDVNGEIKSDELEVNGPATINGQVQITGGNPGANKVLMSDASGTASWATTGGGGGFLTNMATSYMNAEGLYTPHEDNCDATEAFVPIFMGASVGFCMDIDDRIEKRWYRAFMDCIDEGKRLPEYWEYKHACENDGALGLNSMANQAFMSNFPLRMDHNYISSGTTFDYLGILIHKVGSCQESKIESTNFFYSRYRCVR